MIKNLFYSLMIVVMVTGCANLNSIHRVDDLKGENAKIILSDAKQWPVLIGDKLYNSADDQKKKLNGLRIFCTGVSPDAFTALATSLAAQGSVGKSSDPVTKDISAQLSASLSENASTIERTQTVNILRESMYRTCERYLNGAIGTPELIVQAARDQRNMVAVLAIEQLTGVSKAQAIAITASANASVGGISNESIKSFQKARDDAETSRKAAEAKRTEIDAEIPIGVKCADLKTDDDGHKKKKELCDQADKLDKEAASAQAHYLSINASIKKIGNVSSSASGNVISNEFTSGASNAVIADTVFNIVQEVASFDEVEMTCVVLFRMMADDRANLSKVDQSLKDSCRDLVRSRIEKEKAELDLAKNQARLQSQEIQTKVRLNDTQKVWLKVAPAGTLNMRLFNELLNKAKITLPAADVARVRATNNSDEFSAALKFLSPSTLEKLAEMDNN